MFKVGQDVVLNNSSQNKVMKIQAYNDEFIRAYWSKKEYSFAHESNFRHATEQEIAAGHRIDHFVDANNMVDANAGVTVITPKRTSKVKGGMTAFVDIGDDSHIENHVSPLCKMGGEVMRSEFEKAYEPNPHKSPFTEVRFNEEKQIYEPLNPPINHVARSLNAAWYGYRIRQTEVDALTLQVAEMKSRLNDAYTDGQSAMYTARQSKVDELQRRNQMLNGNIKEQGQKLVYQNEVIETQSEKLLGLRDEKAELQKRLDKAIYLLASIKAENDLWGCDQVERQIELLEQALKGDQ